MIWVGTGENNNQRSVAYGDGVYKSEDGGKSWKHMGLKTSEHIGKIIVHPENSDVVYVAAIGPLWSKGGDRGLYKTEDGGKTWNSIIEVNEHTGVNDVVMDPRNPDVLYAATAPLEEVRSHVYVTQDGGDTWTDITQTLPDRYPMDMTVSPDDPAIAYITYSGFGTGHVFRTADFGETWEDISFDLPDVPTNAVIVDPLFPNNIYVGNDIGVFYSMDAGLTWNRYQEGLPSAVMVFDMKIANQSRKLRIATHGNGAYQNDLLEEPVSSTEAITALDLDVFPNPAADQINIKYELKTQQMIQIDLLDASGRLLKNLIAERQATGLQQIASDVSEFDGGIYFLRIQTDDAVIVQKLVKE